MNNVFASLLAAALITGFAQPSAQSQESHPLPAGTTIAAMLDKPVDARKSKVGDEVLAQTTEPVKEDGQIIIPKGSKILGHVTEAKVRSNDDPNSVLGIAFERAVLKKGDELPLKLTIQAVAPDRTSADPPPERRTPLSPPAWTRSRAPRWRCRRRQWRHRPPPRWRRR